VRTTVWFLVLLALPFAATAEEAHLDHPRWSLEIKGGVFTPALKDWARYYGKDSMPAYAVSLAYNPQRQVSIGASAGAMSATGKAYNQKSNSLGGEATYELNPVNVFVIVRGVRHEEQLLVPYIGGGWTRMYYREMITGQETIRGNSDGYHVRGGLQLSLDILDASASTRMYADYGIRNTYFFIEMEHSRVVERTTSLDLGGTAFSGGLLFEF
jgi:hypothetical protein